MQEKRDGRGEGEQAEGRQPSTGVVLRQVTAGTTVHLGMASMAQRDLGPGPPPDLTARFKLKAKYARLQRNYSRALEVSTNLPLPFPTAVRRAQTDAQSLEQIRKDLTIEAEEKDNRVQRLQDEVECVAPSSPQLSSLDKAHCTIFSTSTVS